MPSELKGIPVVSGRYKIATMMLCAFLAGFGVAYSVDLVKSLVCNAECQAQLLLKNEVFFELRGLISTAKQRKVEKIEVDGTRFPPNRLKESGIGVVAVMDSGALVLSGRFGSIVMVAVPRLAEANQIRWHCHFVEAGTDKPPSARACSFN